LIRHLFFRMPFNTPVNFSRRSALQIDDDVNYAIQISKTHLSLVSAAGLQLDGLRVLELGPGVNFAPQLVMASLGVRVAVADRFVVPWDDNYHPAFYRVFSERWHDRLPAVDRILRDGAHSSDVIAIFANPAEHLDSIPPESFDLVISNAVLEHVYSMPAVCREMARVTVMGGLNMHQIDFRDHRDFTRPLEFLTLRDDKFEIEFERRNGEMGNRLRPSESRSMFERTGFELVSLEVNSRSDPNYVKEFLPRLRAAASSRYRDWPESELQILGARLILKKSLPLIDCETTDNLTRNVGIVNA
jgi:hypothetical protein